MTPAFIALAVLGPVSLVLGALYLQARGAAARAEALLWEQRNEFAAFLAQPRPDTSAAPGQAEAAKASEALAAEVARLEEHRVRADGQIANLANWLGQSHEPWLRRHETQLNVMAVRMQAYTGHLDARLGGLTELASMLPGGPDTPNHFQDLRRWRTAAKEVRILPRGETGPCEGVRTARGDRPILVIAFSGIQDVFGWMPRLQSLDVNIVHVVDTSDRWYLDGCDGARRTDWMLNMIAAARREFDVETVATLGSSMGGYAALRFGPELGADVMIAFGPQTRAISQPPQPGINFRSPPPDTVDIREALKASGRAAHVFISASESQNPPSLYFWDDHRQVEGLADAANVHLHVVNCHDHIPSHHISVAGLMDQVLNTALGSVRGEPATIDLDRLLY